MTYAIVDREVDSNIDVRDLLNEEVVLVEEQYYRRVLEPRQVDNACKPNKGTQ